jgi:magnesium-transporting ATPase (P-type)
LNIGNSCKIIDQKDSIQIDLTFEHVMSDFTTTPDLLPEEKTLNSNLKRELERFNIELEISDINCLNTIKNMKFKEKFYMIVDGSSLVEILNSKELSKSFLKLGVACQTVICCRVSPKQKAEVVRLVRTNNKWITLSVGDGANDVAMIREANIGVGIYGKEGTQAVRSSDYAIGQFKFLQRLLMVHGRNGYKRISNFICYYFYKNIILVFTEIYFVFVNGYSGQPFFADIMPILYNTLWTSWPCLVAYSIDRTIKYDHHSHIVQELNYQKETLKNKILGRYRSLMSILYTAGQKRSYFNLKVFWTWLICAIIHGGICFLCIVEGLQQTSMMANGKLIDHWWLTTLSFTVIVHVATYKIYVELSYWNYFTLLTSLISIAFFYLCILMVGIPHLAKVAQNELNETMENMFITPVFWISITLLPFVCLSIDMSMKFFKRFAFPNPLDLFELNETKHE